jgi:hypothetical protein
MKIGKYALDSKEQAQTKIDALGTQTDEDGNTYPTHKHSIVHLGNIVLEQGTYDEDGNEVTPPVFLKNTILMCFGIYLILSTKTGIMFLLTILLVGNLMQ